MRRCGEGGREEENRKVLLDWVKETVGELRREVRSLEEKAEQRGIELIKIEKEIVKLKGNREGTGKEKVKGNREGMRKEKVKKKVGHLTKAYMRTWMGEMEDRLQMLEVSHLS